MGLNMSEPASATSKRRLCVDLICAGPRLIVKDSTGCCALAMVPVCDDPNRGSLLMGLMWMFFVSLAQSSSSPFIIIHEILHSLAEPSTQFTNGT